MDKNVMLFIAFILGVIVFKMMDSGNSVASGCKNCKGCQGASGCKNCKGCQGASGCKNCKGCQG